MILSGLYDQAYQQNHQISFLAYWEALRDPIFFNKHMHGHEISSLILILPSLIPRQSENMQMLEQIIARIPNIVCLEESVLDLPTVMFNRSEAARLAMNHLIGLGHERIAFVGINDQRVTGHKQALQAHNLPYDEQPIDFLEGNLVPAQPAYNIITRMLKAKIKFTGVFTASDEAAIGAIAALKDHGLRVPDDIAVVSIDNIELASMIRPALTTVDIPKHIVSAFRHPIVADSESISRPDSRLDDAADETDCAGVVRRKNVIPRGSRYPPHDRRITRWVGVSMNSGTSFSFSMRLTMRSAANSPISCLCT